MASKLEHILTQLGLIPLYPLFRREKVDDSLLQELSDSDLREIGVAKLGDRKRLLVAFAGAKAMGQPEHGIETRPASKPVDAPEPVSEPERKSKPVGNYADHPGSASLTRPFLNSLGMSFVPTTRSKTLFCTWQVRVLDYQQYCDETQTAFPEVDFEQTPDHPVVNVSWNDSHHFCEWLSKREIWLGLLTARFQYRLPRDDEWSAAVGLPHEHATSPRNRSGLVEGYPWGPDFPPPPGAGNYHARLAVDDFPETSPVGRFPPNKFGLYDMGGNVWEWCMEEYEKGSSFRVLRGGSCFNDDPEFLMSSHRDKQPAGKGRNNVGIRLVLATQSERDPWYKA